MSSVRPTILIATSHLARIVGRETLHREPRHLALFKALVREAGRRRGPTG